MQQQHQEPVLLVYKLKPHLLSGGIKGYDEVLNLNVSYTKPLKINKYT